MPYWLCHWLKLDLAGKWTVSFNVLMLRSCISNAPTKNWRAHQVLRFLKAFRVLPSQLNFLGLNFHLWYICWFFQKKPLRLAVMKDDLLFFSGCLMPCLSVESIGKLPVFSALVLFAKIFEATVDFIFPSASWFMVSAIRLCLVHTLKPKKQI